MVRLKSKTVHFMAKFLKIQTSIGSQTNFKPLKTGQETHDKKTTVIKPSNKKVNLEIKIARKKRISSYKRTHLGPKMGLEDWNKDPPKEVPEKILQDDAECEDEALDVELPVENKDDKSSNPPPKTTKRSLKSSEPAKWGTTKTPIRKTSSDSEVSPTAKKIKPKTEKKTSKQASSKNENDKTSEATTMNTF